VSAKILRRAAAQIRNDHGGVVSRNTQDGRRWLPVADLLDELAWRSEHFPKQYRAAKPALTIARAYLGEQP
jgi:hypothetical protein